ncbi:MAG: hypothetical protein J6A19_11380 [Oscillospiraceae bacterium]|nr:hypothetical protein [Oscillospiraceae bacterium]
MPEKKETTIKRFESTSNFYKTRADREWARAKNGLGDENYGKAKSDYKQAKKFQDKADALKNDD